jgi:hypothetical protein
MDRARLQFIQCRVSGPVAYNDLGGLYPHKGNVHRDFDLLRAVHSLTARSAVPASAVRGKGMTGVAAAARNFLRDMRLERFGTPNPRTFARELDQQTAAMVQALPSDAQHWGVARKVINIFLRDAMYSTYLRDHYALSRAEDYYEVPLDSVTAKALITYGTTTLPAWPGVKHVNRTLNERFQREAGRIAKELDTARVHLDAHWWSLSRDAPAL